MTDEEKAMTNFKNNICSICGDKEACNLSILDCAFYDMIYRQAYLDGLAEGRKTQWHDLRKNPNDFPNPNTAVLVCFQFEEWTTTYIAYYRPAIKKWQIYNLLEAQREPIVDDYIDREEVISWCELPKFEE